MLRIQYRCLNYKFSSPSKLLYQPNTNYIRYPLDRSRPAHSVVGEVGLDEAAFLNDDPFAAV